MEQASQNLDFQECDTCAKLVGSPILCSGCRTNQHRMEILQSEMAKARSALMLIVSVVRLYDKYFVSY